MLINKTPRLIGVLIFFALISQSCKINYTLSGASIPDGAKTISVEHFINRAPLGTATIEQYITDEIKDKFKSQTRLTVISEGGHLNFEGQITNYYPNQPLAITGDETAAQNRFTITVHVKFTNEIDPNFNYDADFTQYVDYDSSLDLASVEQGLVEKIVEKLVEDIFNKAVVNW